MGRLGNIIEKSDGKFFREDYYNIRSRFLYLISEDQINNNPPLEKINILPYEKINTLIQYIENRDYAHRGPLRGRDLRINGFPEIIDEFKMPIKRYPNELCITFSDDQIISASGLINKLVQLESYTALLPYFNKDKKSVYFIDGPAGIGCSDDISKYLQEANVYTDFIRMASQLKSNPYIEIDIRDNNPFVYFPTAYITFARRPYICFEQSNSITFPSLHRSKARYKLCENLDLQYFNGKEIKHNKIQDVTSIFNELFAYPEDSNDKIRKIKAIYKIIFNENIEEETVYYDWVKQCYCFGPNVEDRVFAKYPIKPAKSSYFCKYTSLGTLLCILNSGKMRLNSITTMNDPTETQKLFSEGCNFICENENPDDLKKFANNYYLTSFTSSLSDQCEEDLNMWRFYGDDAKGVCLVFESLIEDHQVFEVNYEDLDSTELMKIETFLTVLKEEGIKFSIQSYVDKYLFIKPKEFQTEKESRLIIGTIDQPEYTVYSNNIVTPYIERKLTYKKDEADSACNTTFPLKLTRIILGPEMKNKDINKLNLESMIQSKSLFRNRVSVDISKLKCYRQ